jgi:hypothetical protein
MIFNIIILIISIIILLYIINKSYKKIVLENFIRHNKPEKLILENCMHNFATDINHRDHKEELCYKSGFVTNPSLLSGICGNGDNKKPLYIIKNKENHLYYGCIDTKDKKINWNLHDRNFTQYELSPYLSKNFTIKNINSSNLIMFLTADDIGVVKANGKTYTHNGSNTLSTFVLPNITYNTQISCSFTNTGSGGGFCISYIWDGRLYILSINGFDSSINSIELNENSNNKVLTNNYNSSIPNMPSFMYNWYNLPQINTQSNISFNAGIISNMASFMNTMTVYLAINGNGVVKLNSKTEYNYNTPNKLVNFNISNVVLGDKLIIDCKVNKLKKDSPLLTIAYIYKGYIFVLDNKNKDTTDIIESSNIISAKCSNWDKRYTQNNSLVIPPFMTGWLSSSTQTSSFSFSTYIGIK